MALPNRTVAQLAERRRQLGLTQRDVAERMGTTQSAVSDLEAGRTDPRWSTVQRYAAAIGARVRVEVLPR